LAHLSRCSHRLVAGGAIGVCDRADAARAQTPTVVASEAMTDVGRVWAHFV